MKRNGIRERANDADIHQMEKKKKKNGRKRQKEGGRKRMKKAKRERRRKKPILKRRAEEERKKASEKLGVSSENEREEKKLERSQLARNGISGREKPKPEKNWNYLENTWRRQQTSCGSGAAWMEQRATGVKLALSSSLWRSERNSKQQGTHQEERKKQT